MRIFCWDIIPQPSDFIHLHHPSSLIPQPSSIFHLPSSIFHLPSSIFHHPSSIIPHPSAIFHLPSSIFHHTSSISHLPSAIFHQPSLPLVLPPILFRHFQKFSKLLHSLRLQLPSIHSLSIRLHPIQHIMLLNPMLRWIPMILLQKPHHLLESRLPPFFLCHSLFFTCPGIPSRTIV